MPIILFLFTYLFLSNQALASQCLKVLGTEYCVGDRVVTSLGDGVLKGLNETMGSIEFTGGASTKKGIDTLPWSQIYKGIGCFNLQEHSFCVGSRAIILQKNVSLVGEFEGFKELSKDQFEVIVGIMNKEKNLKEFYKTNFKNITVGLGCYKFKEIEYCNGDQAVYKNFDGVIVGMNPLSKKISLSFIGGTTRYKGVGTYDLAMIQIGKSCLKDYCVGDKALTKNLSGVIIGINPFLESISIQGDINQKSTILTSRLKEVTKGLKP